MKATAQKQNILAVSELSKNWIADASETFGGPSKSTPHLPASQREIVEGLIEFVETNRFQVEDVEVPETDENGEPMVDEDGNAITTTESVEFDAFGRIMARIIAERLEHTQTRNTASKKLAEAEAKLAELEAQLAKLTGSDAS